MARRVFVAGAAVMISVLLAACQGADAEVDPMLISCGDEVCAADETCVSCATDCGLCPDLCGDETRDTSEHRSTCEADCGICPDIPATVTRGPYLQSGSSSRVVVRWRTDEDTDSVVAYGADPTSATNVVTSSTSTAEHTVRIEGLEADTRYYYAFGSSTAPLIGADDDHFFTTAPQTGAAVPTRIWVLGDSGTANDNARSVRDAYRTFTGSRGTDLWLMLGDNEYDDGTDSEYQEAVFEMYPDTLRNAVLWPTLGNHDGHSAESATQTGPYYDIFTLPTAAEAGGVASGTEAYYAFDYANVHFVCLDSYDSDPDPDGDMMTWLENDLGPTAQPWIVAFWHHPPYSKGSHDSDSEGRLVDMREFALPILEAYGFDLVLSGHSHSYERSVLLADHHDTSDTLTDAMMIDSGDGREGGDGAYEKPGATSEGAVYVVAGSSGKTSSADLDHPAMYISLLELGSVVLDVDDARMDATFLDERWEEALADSLLSSEAGHADGYLVRARAKIALGRINSGVEDYTRAIAGDLAERAGQASRAEHEYREGLAAIDALPLGRQATEAITALRTELTGRLETRRASSSEQVASQSTVRAMGQRLALGAIVFAGCLWIVRRRRVRRARRQAC